MNTTVPSACPLLEMRGIRKSFGSVVALDGVDLTLRAGECLAVCGENGAGKSTLIKILAGAFAADAGDLLWEGRPEQVRSPSSSQHLGISVLYQEFNLVPHLAVRENVFLGREPTRAGRVDHRAERAATRELFARVGVNVDPDRLCSELSVAQQQAVEIAKALSLRARLIVMDEPSAALTGEETERLLRIVRELKAQGLGVIYVSHRLDEVFQIADRVLVLRDGRKVTEDRTARMDKPKLIEHMVGRPLDAEFPRRVSRPGAEALRVENLSRGTAVRDVSFHVREGEIVGFAGLVGSGRTETMRLLFGADRPTGGRMFLRGEPVALRGPRDAIRRGVGLLTEDRKRQGLVLTHSSRVNFGLPNLDRFLRGGFLDERRERAAFGRFVEALRIKLADADQPASSLSGGNQQKVVLAKWLERDCRVVIFDEPTRGIDVGAKYEIYLLMNRLAAEGKAIVMVSSEMPEVLGMSDRIYVMHEGRLKGEVRDVAGATQERLLAMAVS